MNYPDGTPISENPTAEEIEKHFSFWVAQCSEEQREVLQAMHDNAIISNFVIHNHPKTQDELVEMAIKWWMKYYPIEFYQFMKYTDERRAALANPQGFSTDKAKLHMFSGAMPPIVKKLIETVDKDFFRPQNGKNPGYRKFYKIFELARIGGKH